MGRGCGLNIHNCKPIFSIIFVQVQLFIGKIITYKINVPVKQVSHEFHMVFFMWIPCLNNLHVNISWKHTVNFTWKITDISHENFHINFSFNACFSWKFSHEFHKILLNPPLICSLSLIIQIIKTVWSWNFKFRILRKTAVPNTPFYPWVVGKLKAWYSIHFCGLYENKIKSSLSKKIFWQLFFYKELTLSWDCVRNRRSSLYGSGVPYSLTARGRRAHTAASP